MLNQNLTERFESKQHISEWPWKLLTVSLVLFLTMLFGYLGLRFGYRTFLNAKIENVDKEIVKLAESVPLNQQNAFLEFYSQVANLQSLLAKHVIVSKILPLIENNTNRVVSYNRVELNVLENKISFDGFAQSYAVLAQQLEAFRLLKEVKSYNITESRLTEGRVNFKAYILLNPAIFNNQQTQ